MPPDSFFTEKPTMNLELLEKAQEQIPSIPVLINLCSKRVRQINAGFRPYVQQEHPNEEVLDIVLREIAEGKLIAEIDFSNLEDTAEPK